jgi:hypothetical protein
MSNAKCIKGMVFKFSLKLTRDLADLELKPGRVKEKTGKEKIQCDTTTRSKIQL